MIEQFRVRQDLQELAAVPLLLTFCCLIGDESRPGLPGGDAGLPITEYELYERVVARLLNIKTLQQDDAVPPITECMALLTQWASIVAHETDPVNGLGRWSNTITVDAVPPRLCAVDNVAPLVETDAEGTQQRSFLHRTVLEHLVARYVVSLPINDAIEILLPHLWYDADWHHVLATAIAQHPEHNALLEGLLRRALLRPGEPPPGQILDTELHELLARITGESLPDQWQPAQRTLLGSANVAYVPWHLEISPTTRQWLNPSKLFDLITQELSFYPAGSTRLLMLAWIAILSDTDAKAQTAIDAVAVSLSGSGLFDLSDLVDGIDRLADTGARRQYAKAALLSAQEHLDQPAMGILRALSRLEGTVAARRQAISTIADCLNDKGAFFVPDLVDAMVSLGESDETRDDACKALKAALPTAETRFIPSLVGGLVRLADTDSRLQDARHAVICSLSMVHPWEVGGLVDSLTSLSRTNAQRNEAVDAIRAALPHAAPAAVRGLVTGLVRLPHETDWHQEAVNALLGALDSADAWDLPDISDLLVRLSDTTEHRQHIVCAVSGSMMTAYPRHLPALAETLLRWDDTRLHRDDVIRVALDAAVKCKASTMGPLVDVVSRLGDDPAGVIRSFCA